MIFAGSKDVCASTLLRPSFQLPSPHVSLCAPDRRLIAAVVVTSTAGLYLYYLFPLVIVAQLIFLTLMRRRYPSATRSGSSPTASRESFFCPGSLPLWRLADFRGPTVAWIPPARWYDPVFSLYTLVVGTTNNPWQAFNWVTFHLWRPWSFCDLEGTRSFERSAWLSCAVAPCSVRCCPPSIPPVRHPRETLALSRRYLLPELPALLHSGVVGGSSFSASEFPAGPARLSQLRHCPCSYQFGECITTLLTPVTIGARRVPTWRRTQIPRMIRWRWGQFTWPYSYYDTVHLSRVAFYAVPKLFTKAMDESLEPESTRLWLLTATIPGSAHRLPLTPADQLAVASRRFW